VADQGTPDGHAPEGKNGRGPGAQYQVLGMVFALLGLVLLLGTDSRAAGLPFVIVGIVFLGMSRKGRRPPSGAAGE
jgi:O-antigen ligase